MRVTGPGHLIYATAFAGLGVLSLTSGDFAMNWQPVPAWVPWREPLAYASMLSLFTLLVWAPRVVAGPTIRFEWTALCASAAITGAAWAVADSLRGVAWGLVGWRSAEPAHHRRGSNPIG
jgi:hypothetical protein